MRVLLVKTSSMGDVVHALTAVREAKQQHPELIIDWLVEESFADIARLAKDQGDIANVIPVPFRRWRKQKPLGVFCNANIRALKQTLRERHYDLVLDAQGLFKSLFLARLAGAPIAGFDRHSAREALASIGYRQRYRVEKNQHAIERLRQLFAQALSYPLPASAPPTPHHSAGEPPTILLFHGTTWDNKSYPTAQWHQLAKRLQSQGYRLLIPRHGAAETRVATAIADGLNNAEILPEQSINALFSTLQSASAVVSVDTGLAHLAVYLGVPTVMLFGPTRADLTGGIGAHTINVVGKATDTACMKRQSYGDENQFSPSMSAIAVDEILASLQNLGVTTAR